jgi:hypothetical protein
VEQAMTLGRNNLFGGFRLEFASPEVENQYWLQRRDRDLARTRMFVAVVMAAVLIFSISDYLFFGMSATWGWLALARVIGVITSVVTLMAIRRAVTRHQLPWIILIWSLIMITVGAYIVSTRPINYIGHILPAAVFVLIGYFMLPSAWIIQLIPGLLVTFAYTILFWQTASPVQETGVVAVATTFVAVNLLGWFWAVQQEHWKRTSFMTLRRETELRTSLERALAEIKTLRNIVPICSHCKLVRTNDGHWHEVEVYVRQHTQVDFSHGFCPDCMKVYCEEYLPASQV